MVHLFIPCVFDFDYFSEFISVVEIIVSHIDQIILYGYNIEWQRTIHPKEEEEVQI